MVNHFVAASFLRLYFIIFSSAVSLLPWIPEIRNESFDRVSPIIYFQEQPTAV